MFHTRDVKRSVKKKKNMSGKSGQVLTSSFYDDCENIILYNGYPAFVVNLKASQRFLTLEDASKTLGLSVDVLKDLSRLANVKLLHKKVGPYTEDLEVYTLYRCLVSRRQGNLNQTLEFGVPEHKFILDISFDANGEYNDGRIQLPNA